METKKTSIGHPDKDFCETAYRNAVLINPDNPIAVAKSITKLYEALKVYIEHQEGTRGHYCSVCHNKIEQALAEVDKGG